MYRFAMVTLVISLFAVTASAQTAVTLACGDSAQGENMAGATGTQFMVTCPAGCGSSTIWGTGIYSDDSSVCTAAIHAGQFAAADGGAVLVTIADGQEAYHASAANGVSSNDWPQWQRSFTVGTFQFDCYTTAQTLPGDPGSLHLGICPAGCAAGGTVWGTDIYSDDSSICTAAVHTGAITDAGGDIVILIIPGQTSYTASSQNGVDSADWPEWGRSFGVTGVE